MIRWGNLTSVADPIQRQTQFTYDDAGNLKTEIDAKQKQTVHEYDARNDRISTTNRTNDQTRFEYDSRGRRITRINPNGDTMRWEYDNRGRQAKVIDAAGDEIVYDYGDALGQSQGIYPGQINKITYPTFTQIFDYDARNRRIKITDDLDNNLLHITQTRYDAKGNRIREIDAEGRVTHYQYDAQDRLAQIIEPIGQNGDDCADGAEAACANAAKTGFSYDDRDNLLSVIDPNSHTTTYEYDKLDRRTTEIRPLGQSTGYTYDPNSNLTQTIDPDTRIAQSDYDIADQLLVQRFYLTQASLSPERTVAYTHDANGNIATWDDGTYSATYIYDDEDRQTQTTTDYGPFTLTDSRTYDPNGNVKTITDPTGYTIEYHRDAADRLNRLTLPGTGSITWGDYRWSQPQTILLPGGITRSLEYDNRMRITKIDATAPNMTLIQGYDYQYDKTDNITQKATRDHGNYDYQYDERQRLIHATIPWHAGNPEGWTYDANGNRKSDNHKPGTWDYDDNDRLLQSPLASYQYDHYGNLTQETKATGQVLSYRYNAESRLSEITGQSDPLNPIFVAAYVYDPMGRRIKKNLPDENDTAQTTDRYFHYTNEGLAGEYTGQGQPIQRYGYEPDGLWTTDPTYTITEQGVAFYHSDHLGTPQALTDVGNNIIWAGRMLAFGELDEVVGGVEQPLRFGGQYSVGENGNYYNFHRTYSFSTGRYLERDPIGIEGGINTYGYSEFSTNNRIGSVWANAKITDTKVPYRLIPIRTPQDVVDKFDKANRYQAAIRKFLKCFCEGGDCLNCCNLTPLKNLKPYLSSAGPCEIMCLANAGNSFGGGDRENWCKDDDELSSNCNLPMSNKS